jgi:hypothetical protein
VVLLTHSGPSMRSPGCEPTHSASPIPTRPLSLLVGGPSLKGLPARRGIVNNPTTADKPTAPAGGDWSRLSSGWGLGGAGSAESTRIGPNRSVSEEQRGVPLGEHPLPVMFAIWPGPLVRVPARPIFACAPRSALNLFRASCQSGLELVSKRRDRPYQAGRAKHWIR